LIDYYRGHGKLHVIDGELPIDEVNRRIEGVLEGGN
jgi:adenylate kinase family enzyme